jgi:predicted nucleic acid-binding protein
MNEKLFTKKCMKKKGVRIFLDSNVILSGLLSDTGAPGVIFDILSLNLPLISAVTGRYNIIEVERNIKKKLPALLPVYKNYFRKAAISIVALPSAEEIKLFDGIINEKDAPVLASAAKGKADFLLTGDKKHFQKLKISGICSFAIVSPTEFLETILPELLTK